MKQVRAIPSGIAGCVLVLLFVTPSMAQSPKGQGKPPDQKQPVYWEGYHIRRQFWDGYRDEGTARIKLREEPLAESDGSFRPLTLVSGTWSYKIDQLVSPKLATVYRERGDTGTRQIRAATVNEVSGVWYDEDPYTQEPRVELRVQWAHFPQSELPTELTLVEEGEVDRFGHAPKRLKGKVKARQYGIGWSGRFDPHGTILRSYKREKALEEITVLRRSSELVELVVYPDPGNWNYETWRPQGAKDEGTPGNHLQILARLENTDGKTPPEKAKKITFRLLRVSREPGVCMNWPPKEVASGSAPDLQFDPEQNPHLKPPKGKERQKIETPPGAYSEATAVVSAYDWGAYGRLEVTATMSDGRTITGHLSAQVVTKIPIPLAYGDFVHIPDWWKRDHGLVQLSDNDDSENDPVGDGYPGDGLSLYEEYRGFYEDGKHIEGNPHKKDFFIRNEIAGPGTRDGIKLFASTTGLKVHDRLNKDEIGEDRVINFNHKTAHVVDQHGVLIIKGDPGHYGGAAFGGPGTPKDVEKIVLHPGPVSFFPRRRYADLVAHELGHAVNIYHHGVEDFRRVQWKSAKDTKGVLQLFETSLKAGKPVGSRREVDVYSEDRTQFYSPEMLMFRGGGRRLYVAVQGGEHSGREDCVMRYNCAGAVAISPSAPLRYVWWDNDEDAGGALCDKPDGTGVNDPSRSPRPRYGNAFMGLPGRGDCVHQIRVNDKGTAPIR